MKVGLLNGITVEFLKNREERKDLFIVFTYHEKPQDKGGPNIYIYMPNGIQGRLVYPAENLHVKTKSCIRDGRGEFIGKGSLRVLKA